ncbi:MAG: glycosyltransferase family 87 protein [Candidatus Aminicenantales bacterium]
MSNRLFDNYSLVGYLVKIMNIKKAFLWPVVLLLFSAGVFLLFSGEILPRMVDFEVNYKAAQRLTWGETLYRVADGHYQFKYPPLAAFLYLPLILFPLPIAKFIWFYLSLLASAGLLLGSARLVAKEQKWRWWLPVGTGVILARYFLRELSLGQINAMITFGLIMFVHQWEKTITFNKSNIGSFIPGLLFALTTASKPYALIFFPLIILRRAWKIFLFSSAFLAAAFFLPTIFYGFHGNWLVHKEWLSHLRQSTPPLLSSQDNVSIYGLLAKWGGPGFPAWIGGTIAVVFMALVMLWAVLSSSRLRRPLTLEASALLLLIPLVSPLGWDYNFISAAPAISLLLTKFSFLPRRDKYFLVLIFAAISLSIYDLLGRKIYSSLMALCLPTFLFLIIFLHLLWLRYKKTA